MVTPSCKLFVIPFMHLCLLHVSQVCHTFIHHPQNRIHSQNNVFAPIQASQGRGRTCYFGYIACLPIVSLGHSAWSRLICRTKQVQDTHVSKDTVIKKDKSPVTGELPAPEQELMNSCGPIRSIPHFTTPSSTFPKRRNHRRGGYVRP